MRYAIVALFLAMVIFFSCGSNEGKNNPDPNTKKTGKPKEGKRGFPGGDFSAQAPTAIPVEVSPLVRGRISSFLLYNSTLETEEMAEVYSRISGLVEKLVVEEGDRVKKNQPLAYLERDTYVLDEENARLQYDKQKSEFNRFKALKEKNLVSEEEFETKRLALRQAELQWKQAQLNLDYTIIRSPINGVVGERFIRLGDRIQPSTKLFVIANLNKKEVKLYVPQDELLKCYHNQRAVVTTDVAPDKKFAGWVKRISPIVDPVSGTFKVTVGVKDPQNILHPGMFLSTMLVVDSRENALLLPKPAILYENERSYFFILLGDSVQKIELKKGFEDAEKVEVLNPVPDSVAVVVVGQEGLKDGSKVEVMNEKHYPWQNLSKETRPAKISRHTRKKHGMKKD